MKKDVGEIGASLGIIAFCLLLVQQAVTLPKPRFEPLGPSFFPLLVLWVIIGLSLLHIAFVLWKAWKRGQIENQPTGKWRPTYENLLPWLSVLVFVVYILLISYTEIPYLILTFFFVGLLAWAMASFRKGAIIPAVGVAAGLIFVIQGVFVTALDAVLP